MLNKLRFVLANALFLLGNLKVSCTKSTIREIGLHRYDHLRDRQRRRVKHVYEHFTVMFEAPSSKNEQPDNAAAGEKAFGIFLAFVKDCQESSALPAGDILPVALLAWMMVHGTAKLAITGRFHFARRPRF